MAGLQRHGLVPHRLAPPMPGWPKRIGGPDAGIRSHGRRSLHQRRTDLARCAPDRTPVAQLEPAALLAPARSPAA
ncbi:hypothetical protein G6F40_018014 [Rhizopus arrhizus]|nr:hypothetical protein G6F40_018014 [Rhizopus arrhizus]